MNARGSPRPVLARIHRPCAARRLVLAAALLLLLAAACDPGLEPPETPAVGTVQGVVSYAGGPAAWPPDSAIHDLRFFALPFVPADTLDFFRDLNLLVFSEPLTERVAQEAFVVRSVPAGVYVYSGVAQQFSNDLLDWRPVGLYTGAGGVFEVRPGAITELALTVDFSNLPPFPPGSAR